MYEHYNVPMEINNSLWFRKVKSFRLPWNEFGPNAWLHHLDHLLLVGQVDRKRDFLTQHGNGVFESLPVCVDNDCGVDVLLQELVWHGQDFGSENDDTGSTVADLLVLWAKILIWNVTVKIRPLVK